MQKYSKSSAIKFTCFAEMQHILCKNIANRTQSSLFVLLRCSIFYAKLAFFLIFFIKKRNNLIKICIFAYSLL